MSVNINELDECSFYEFPLFEGLSRHIVDAFVAVGKVRTFEADSPLVVSEDKGQTFFMILDGLAKVTLYRGTDRQISLMILKQSDFFGEMALLENHQSRTANVFAMTEVRALTVEKVGFYEVMLKYPELALNLARSLGHRIRMMNERTVALTLSPAKKVARTLMLVAYKPPLDHPSPIQLPKLSMDEWLQFCHSDQAELRACLDRMQDAGAIEWNHEQITIQSVQLLKEFAVGTLS